MTNSFVLAKGKLPQNLAPYCAKLSTYKGHSDLKLYESLSIGFSNPFNPDLYYHKGDIIIWLLPTAYKNKVDAKVVFNINQAIVNHDLHNNIPESCPNFLAYHKVQQRLFVFNSSPGYLPLYYGISAGTFWLTTEAKAFIHSNEFKLKLRSYDFFSGLNYQAPFQSQSIFENLNRLKSNELLTVDGANEVSIFQVNTTCVPLRNFSEKEIANQLFELLNAVIAKNAVNSNQIGVALSGGYDSGSIAGILFRQNVKFNTITIGSRVANEFSESKIVADAVQAANYPIMINDADYLQTYLEMIFINEINDAVIAEAFVGIYELYQSSSNYCSDLFTGYGADILLGNLLNTDAETINHQALQFINRCGTTGELSPYIADKFKINIHHIYLDQEIIDFCLAIPGALKIKNKTNKYLQKKMLIAHQLIPKEILEIKKKGLHEGSGLPAILSEKLGVEKTNYRVKNRFLYNSLKMLFENGIEPNLCDVDYIIDQTKKQDKYDS